MTTLFKKAVQAINKKHIVLVYPLKTNAELPSLWSTLYPKSKMRWDWSEEADQRVVDTWHLKDELSQSDHVVYSKWFRGRATFFSKEIFTSVLSIMGSTRLDEIYDSQAAHDIYQELLSESPLTPKMIKERLDFGGRKNRALYGRAIKILWERALIAGAGEVDEGQFPALSMGATRHFFEDEWDRAHAWPPEEARKRFKEKFPPNHPVYRFLNRLAIKYTGSNLEGVKAKEPVTTGGDKKGRASKTEDFAQDFMDLPPDLESL